MNQREIFEITSIDQVKAISNDVRLNIVIEMFRDNKPRTAKQIADEIGMPAPKAFYHVKELVKVGLLVLTETKVKAGIIEKYYLPVAKEFSIKMMGSSGEGKEVRRNYLAILFDQMKKDYLKTIGQETTERNLYQLTVNLTLDEIDLLHEDIKEVFQRWNKFKQNDNQSSEKHEYGLVLGMYPKKEREE